MVRLPFLFTSLLGVLSTATALPATHSQPSAGQSPIHASMVFAYTDTETASSYCMHVAEGVFWGVNNCPDVYFDGPLYHSPQFPNGAWGYEAEAPAYGNGQLAVFYHGTHETFPWGRAELSMR